MVGGYSDLSGAAEVGCPWADACPQAPRLLPRGRRGSQGWWWWDAELDVVCRQGDKHPGRQPQPQDDQGSLECLQLLRKSRQESSVAHRRGFCLPHFGVFLMQEEQKTAGFAFGCNGDVISAQNVNKCMERTFSSVLRTKMTQLGTTMQGEEGAGASWSTRTSGGIKLRQAAPWEALPCVFLLVLRETDKKMFWLNILLSEIALLRKVKCPLY